MKFLVSSALIALATASFSTRAIADSAGEREFQNYCASCHGAAGMGAGPMAEYLNVPVPDLTQIAARNEGKFPFLEVIHIIDGRTGLKGHGSSMPVWGTQFMIEAGDTMAGDYSSFNELRGRVLSLGYYLESIQK